MMPRTIFLDTFAVSSMGRSENASSEDLTVLCRDWVYDCMEAGNTVIVSAITYFEALREMERRKAAGQISRLKRFCFSAEERFLPLTTADLELAAQLWAQVRNAGQPTASPDALDVDVILAAQSLSLGLPQNEFFIATTNVGHLERFVPAADWQSLIPGS